MGGYCTSYVLCLLCSSMFSLSASGFRFRAARELAAELLLCDCEWDITNDVKKGLIYDIYIITPS